MLGCMAQVIRWLGWLWRDFYLHQAASMISQVCRVYNAIYRWYWMRTEAHTVHVKVPQRIFHSPDFDIESFLPWIQSHFYINTIIQLQHPLLENQLFFLLTRKQCKSLNKVSFFPLTLQSLPLMKHGKCMCQNSPLF